MIRYAAALFCVTCLFIAGVWRHAMADAARRRPELGFASASGTAASLRDFRGNIVLIDVWASWCAPCLKALPELEKLSRDLRARGLSIVPLSVDRAGVVAAARSYRRAAVETLPLYVGQPEDVTLALRVTKIPTMIVLDRHGYEVRRFQGDQEASPGSMRAALLELLASDDQERKGK